MRNIKSIPDSIEKDEVKEIKKDCRTERQKYTITELIHKMISLQAEKNARYKLERMCLSKIELHDCIEILLFTDFK